jgi:hypothetical protein
MVYDSSLGDSKPKPRGQRQVYSHDIDTRGQRQVYSHDIDTDVSYGDSTPLDSYNDWEVYNASYDRGPRLSKDQWERLSEDARRRWDKFPPETKHIILEAKSRPRPPARRANLHDLTRSDLDGIDTFDFLQAHLHELSLDTPASGNGSDITPLTEPSSMPDQGSNTSDASKSVLLAHLTKRTNLPPGDLQRVLSSSINKPKGSSSVTMKSSDININGKQYREVSMTNTLYVASDHRTVRRGALIDRGANGGIAGDDVRIIHESGRQVGVQGINNHQIVNIPIVMAGAVINTRCGEVILIMNQYAWTKKGKTIHSSGQMEWYKQDVDDKSRRVGGKQCIKTIDGITYPSISKVVCPTSTCAPTLTPNRTLYLMSF